MTIIVRDDFLGVGNLDPLTWADTVINFYQGQTGPNYMQQNSGFCVAAVDFGSSVPAVPPTFNAILYNGKGEATTVPLATVPNQYIEAGIKITTFHPSPDQGPHWDDPVYSRPGQVLLGFRLTGGGGTIEGITVQCSVDFVGTLETSVVAQKTGGVFSTLGSANQNITISDPGPPLSSNYVVRMEVTGSSVVVMVNALTILTVNTDVTQVGGGYFCIDNTTVYVAPGGEETPPAGFYGTNNFVDYIEYGETEGPPPDTAINTVEVSGGGSPTATTTDTTTLDPALVPQLYFALDTHGAGDGMHLQQINRTAFTVGPQLAISSGDGVIGGVADNQGVLYIPVEGTPPRVWKVDSATFTELGLQPLTGTGVNPYPQLDNNGNIYFLTYSGVNALVYRVLCSDLSIVDTLTIPNFAKFSVDCWDATAIDIQRNNLYVAGGTGSPAHITMAKIDLGTFTLTSMRDLTPAMTTANCAFVYGPHIYIGGGNGDFDGDPTNAFWRVEKFNLVSETVTAILPSFAENQVSCGVLDAAAGKGYFGNFEGSTAKGKIWKVDLASLTIDGIWEIDPTVDNTMPVRAVAVDSTYVYGTFTQDIGGTPTWKLARVPKAGFGFASVGTAITDVTWTDGVSQEGSKTIMVI